MMNDSVREELEIKATPNGNLLNQVRKGVSAMQSKPNQPKMAAPPKPIFTARDTGELLKKPAAPPQPTVESSPTLVEFQNKNATLPDWRLKMQNAVRQRIENPAGEENAPKEIQQQTRLVTSGANALKPQIVEEIVSEPLKNEKVANALKRIELSRKAFFVEETAPETDVADDASQNKNYPFYIAARTNETAAKPADSKASVNAPPKPKLVTNPTRNADGELDTNKLPPLPMKSTTSFDMVAAEAQTEIADPQTNKAIEPVMLTETAVQEKIFETQEVEESDDLAPFAMRFNAGLFDLIIGSFASFVLLAPFMLSGGEWMTFTGLLAFAATLSVVMFIYLTSSIGMFGRSIGMRLFSLELVDVEQNEYPTFHQAAVSSSVYLLSLIFGGIGFLTIPFNEEKRAVHDIVSGTIVVKEY
jgi:uncharacterized RDD family membrane protein YckC